MLKKIPGLKFVLNCKWLVENSPQEHILIHGSGREERATLFVEEGRGGGGGMKRVRGEFLGGVSGKRGSWKC